MEDIARMKEIIIRMKPDELTKEFIQRNFCKRYNVDAKQVIHPLFEVTDVTTLKEKEFHDCKACKTTLGRIIINKVLFEPDNLYKILGYVNLPLTKNNLEKIETMLMDAMLEGQIETLMLGRYFDRVQWLGMTFHSSLCGSFTDKTISPLPQIVKLREQLFKKYEKELQGPNYVSYIIKIQNELMAVAKQELKGDPGMDLYDSGARGSFENNYKNMMIMRGLSYNNVTKKYDYMKHSFSEGMSKEDVSFYGNSVIAGAYPSAIATAQGGYMTKKFFAVYQSSVLDEDRNSDCHSKRTRRVLLTEKNYRGFKYRWIVDRGKLVCLTPTVAPKYYNQYVQMRSPMYCCGQKYCAKCMGDLFYRLQIKNIGLITSTLSNGIMNRDLKAKHDGNAKISKINISDILL